jgi:hypothetical protein
LTSISEPGNVCFETLVMVIHQHEPAGDVEMKIRTAKVGLAVCALSTASFVVSGFGGSAASAAIRSTNAKLCKQYHADTSKTNYTAQEQVSSYRKLAKVAPGGLKTELVKLAGELQSAVDNGATKSQENSLKALFGKIQSQLNADCGS